MHRIEMKETFEERLRNQKRGSVDIHPDKKLEEQKKNLHPHLSNLKESDESGAKTAHVWQAPSCGNR